MQTITEVIWCNMQGCVQAVACTGLPGTAVIVVGTSNGTIAAYETVGSSDPQQIGKAEAAGAVQSVSIILEPLEVAPCQCLLCKAHSSCAASYILCLLSGSLHSLAS